MPSYNTENKKERKETICYIQGHVKVVMFWFLVLLIIFQGKNNVIKCLLFNLIQFNGNVYWVLAMYTVHCANNCQEYFFKVSDTVLGRGNNLIGKTTFTHKNIISDSYNIIIWIIEWSDSRVSGRSGEMTKVAEFLGNASRTLGETETDL